MTNSWLYEKLKNVNLSPGQELELIVEVEEDYTDEVARELEARDVEVHRERVSWGRFIPIVAPVEVIPIIQEIPHVVKVHYSMPKYPYFFLFPRKVDPLIGEIGVSEVEIPFAPHEVGVQNLLTLPFGGPLGPFFGPLRPRIEAWPTSRTREIIGAPRENTVITRVAVLDTGAPLPIHPLVRGRRIEAISTTGEAPWDGLGHGTWCHTTAFMGELPTRFGDVKSVSNAISSMHGKCLSNAGFGSTESVLKAMEAAYKWGAKIVSMSLGGSLQGSVKEDPECRIIEETEDEVIWVVAAGNANGEGVSWKIGSPGCAPYALTVAAYSPRYEDVAVYSSRGWNGGWYNDHPERWEADLTEYGDILKKPDLMAHGVGPVEENQRPMDLIYSGCQGWVDGMYDLSPGEGLELMRGTCLVGDTMVYTPDGPIPIKDVPLGKPTYCVGERRIGCDVCSDFIPQGKRMVYELETTDGKSIFCTSNHLFLGSEKGYNLKWIPLKDLEPGRHIFVVHRVPTNADSKLDELISVDMANFLGKFLGDGWIQHSKRLNRISVPTSDEEFIEQFNRLFEKQMTPSNYSWSYADSKRLTLALSLLGFYKKHKKTGIPRWVFHLQREKIRSFIGGLLDADGWGSKRDGGKRIELSSRRLVEDLKLLCEWRAIKLEK